MIILLDSVIYACMLCVLCVGLSLTYKITRVPNFAHTTFAILGMYMALIVTKVFGTSPYFAIPLAFAVSGATSLFLYYCVIRVLQKRRSSYLSLIVATLSFDIFMIGMLNILADYVANTFQIVSRDFTLRSFDVFVFDVPMILIVCVAVLSCVGIGLYYLLYHTRFGVTMRASIENTSLASVYRINTNRVFCVSWFLSGAMGGIAGVLLAVWFQGDPSLSGIMLPSVFAGSIVGGFGSIFGAILGGAIIGFSEILGTNALASVFGYWIVPYRPLIPFVAIIVTLLVFPKGLAEMVSRVRGS